jgi:RNA polymerase sigma-70 factor (ECF subfamily)
MDKKSLNSEFIELLTLNYYKIHSFILALVPNRTDAEDILQSAITYMWEHFTDFKKGTNFLSWAFTISKYQVLTYRKKQKRSIIHFSEKAMNFIEQENMKLSQDLDARLDALNTCMKKLNSKNLIFIKKRFEKKISVIDLAAEFGISVNTAYKRLAQIKSFLLNCIHKAMAAGDLS